MKQYRHKKTGYVTPPWNTEDWEEIKSEPEVPHGIVSFKDGRGVFEKPLNGLNYDWWVKDELKLGSTINSIRVNDVVWEVGEIVDIVMGFLDNPIPIKSFEYNNGEWFAKFHNNGFWAVKRLKKLPTKKPIATVQDRYMYDGDSCYYVDYSFNISIWKFSKDQDKFPSTLFINYSEAEQYIKDNKPVYPAGLVDEIIELSDKRPYGAMDSIWQICQYKLKQFKK